MRDSDDEIVYVMSPENLLRALIISAGIPGGFDTPEFRKILEAAKNEKIRAGIERASIVNILREETNKYGSNDDPGKTGFGSGVKMYGLPADGVSSGVAVYPSDFCAIPDGAKNKRAAWEFLKTYLDTVPDYRFEHHDEYWIYVFLLIGTRTGYTLKSASEKNFTDNESLFCFYQNGDEILFEYMDGRRTRSRARLGRAVADTGERLPPLRENDRGRREADARQTVADDKGNLRRLFRRDSVARRDDNPTYLVFRGKVISETSAKVTT